MKMQKLARSRLGAPESWAGLRGRPTQEALLEGINFLPLNPQIARLSSPISSYQPPLPTAMGIIWTDAQYSVLERVARARQAEGQTKLPTRAALFAEWTKSFSKNLKSDKAVYSMFKKLYGIADEEEAALGHYRLVMKDVSLLSCCWDGSMSAARQHH